MKITQITQLQIGLSRFKDFLVFLSLIVKLKGNDNNGTNLVKFYSSNRNQSPYRVIELIPSQPIITYDDFVDKT